MTIEVLRRLRGLMADPEQVVRNPEHLYEDFGGRATGYRSRACRGCFIGNYCRAARGVGGIPDLPGFVTMVRAWQGRTATEELIKGRENCVAIVDAAIARAEVEIAERAHDHPLT